MQRQGAGLACEKKLHLLCAYSHAVLDHDRVVTLLHDRAGLMSQREYQRVLALAERARASAEEARAALDKHVAEHGC